jgi:hypothetical protein
MTAGIGLSVARLSNRVLQADPATIAAIRSTQLTSKAIRSKLYSSCHQHSFRALFYLSQEGFKNVSFQPLAFVYCVDHLSNLADPFLLVIMKYLLQL